jgi:SAM-dependent methyltransferase
VLTALLGLSDLAREGIAHRGSFRFADHLYKAEPSGRFGVGYCLDSVFLHLPAASAFRRRYLHARDTMAALVRSRAGRPVRILTVPCGIPRDVVDMAGQLACDAPASLAAVSYIGMDIDPEALRVAAEFVRERARVSATFHCGDALDPGAYPSGRFDVVSSTGLTEFLDDEQVERLFRNIYDVLEPGGTFYTSATARDPFSALLLQVIDLRTHYRSQAHLASILDRVPWRSVRYVIDSTGLQTFVTATR